MSTLVKDRKQSAVQFLATMRQLVNHTVMYAGRLPKSVRIVWTFPMVKLAQDAMVELHCANAIRKPKLESDYVKRRSHLHNALGYLDALEEFVSCIGVSVYRKDVTRMSDYQERNEGNEPYAFFEWGYLLETERKLINGLLKKDEKSYNKSCADIGAGDAM